jgi:hypothetical protein
MINLIDLSAGASAKVAASRDGIIRQPLNE